MEAEIETNHLVLMESDGNFLYQPGEDDDSVEFTKPEDHNAGCFIDNALKSPVNTGVSLEAESVIGQELQVLRGKVGAANQILPLITSVYEDRDSFETASGGLLSEYRIALQEEYKDSRTCLVCGAIFLSPTKLLHHAQSQHALSGLCLQRCFVCKQPFVFLEAMLLHLQEFHGLPSPHLTCCICYCQFTSKAELKAHTRKHGREEKCSLCYAHFATKSQLCEHNDSNHSKPYQCQSCRLSFSNENVLKLHESHHMRVEKWTCECGFHASMDCEDPELTMIMHIHGCKPNDLDMLLNVLQSEEISIENLDNLLLSYEKKSESEPLCSSSAQCLEDIVTSVSEMIPQGPAVPIENVLSKGDVMCRGGEFTCQLCKNPSDAIQCTAEYVQQHMLSAHPRAKVCPMCRKHFSSASRARSHAQRHALSLVTNSTSPQVFKCEHCDKLFKSKGRLHYHLEQQHTIAVLDKPYMCPVCPRKFCFPGIRDKHCASHTQGRKTEGTNTASIYKCQFCPKTFIKAHYLRLHEDKFHPKLSDSQVLTKPFECAHCGWVFESLLRLRRHREYNHGCASDKQRYQCPYCPVGCRFADGLKIHLRVHTGERPYTCSICEQAFKRKQVLTDHLWNVHKQTLNALMYAKLYQCVSCEVQLNKRSAMLSHFLRTHRQVRRYICGLCGKKYSENQQLKYHMVTTHKIHAPSVPTSDRLNQTKVHVWPKIEELSTTQAILISKIVAEETQKTNLVPDFPVVKLRPTHANSNGSHLKPSANTKLNTIDMIDCAIYVNGLHFPINTTSATRVPINLNRNQDLSHNDSNTTLTDQHEISSNAYQHSSSAQDATSLKNLNACVTNVIGKEAVTNKDDSSALETADTSKSPLMSYNTLHYTPQQVLRVPINSTSKCCSNASTSELSGIPKTLLSPEISLQRECNKSKIHKHKMLLPFQGNTQSATMRVDKSKAINNIGNNKSLPTDLSHSSSMNAQPKAFSEMQDRMFKCNVCDKHFIDIKRLERHNKTHSGLHTFVCNICNKAFLEKHNLMVHMRTHSGSRPFQCEECGKSMRYHQELEDHQRAHRGDKPFICPHCPDQSYARAKDLKRHEKAKHQPSNTGWPCSLCGKVFARKDSAEVHKKKVHLKELQPTFGCNVCGHKFSTENLLHQHRLLHSGYKEHACTQCGKSFVTKAYLQKHVKLHELSKYYLPCSSCPRKFTTPNKLMIHQKTFHNKNVMQAKLKLQGQVQESDSCSFENQNSDCFVQMESDVNVELDIAQLLGPVNGDKDIQVVYLQVLSDVNL